MKKQLVCMVALVAGVPGTLIASERSQMSLRLAQGENCYIDCNSALLQCEAMCQARYDVVGYVALSECVRSCAESKNMCTSRCIGDP
jgi:hypothetical protein